MIRNYIKIAWRNLQKHRLFSLINICGLAIGIAAFWMIALYVTDEWSYDRYNDKADRIFRVAQHGKWQNGGFNLALTSIPYAPALKNDYPEVEEAIRIDQEGGGKITYDNKQFDVGDISFTDANIFKVFTYHFLEGDPETALAKPHSIVLTKSLAEKIFGDAANAVAVRKMHLVVADVSHVDHSVLGELKLDVCVPTLRVRDLNILGPEGDAGAKVLIDA